MPSVVAVPVVTAAFAAPVLPSPAAAPTTSGGDAGRGGKTLLGKRTGEEWEEKVKRCPKT